MDTGRLYIDKAGTLRKESIKHCPGVVGAVTRDDIAMLKCTMLPISALKGPYAYGRTPIMLAALYRSWRVLIYLLQQPASIDWQQVSAKSSMLLCSI